MNQVILTRDGITIHDKKEILLCASLFYFRIPRAEWEDRIIKLKASGYNCVDVYFPWNFHEITPGKWDFSGEKDVREFLDLLVRYDLYVIARPGPYICSEWDGGAIPAWILTDRSLNIRQNDVKFLDAVHQWYEKILPCIASHQIDRGGTVILMQIENELDFFDCTNPRAYMGALRDMARDMHITVPLFGCAGQANLEGATGWADGVDAIFNFYGNVCDATYGEKFHYYSKRMGELNRPLMISETCCDHLFLRRELAAKLISPYNQVGGTNFGFSGSLNNWGDRNNPLSFITTHYTGDNMIGSAGELQEQYFEGRRFAGLIHTFGAALGGAQSLDDESLSVVCEFSTNTVFYRLALVGGGSLVCVPNLSQQSGRATITCGESMVDSVVSGHSAPFFPFNIPLSLFGHEGILVCADGELENCEMKGNELVFTFWTESESPFAKFNLNGKSEKLTREHPSCCGICVVLADKRDLRNKTLYGVKIPSRTECAKRYPVGSFHKVSLSGDLRSKFSYIDRPVRSLEEFGVYRGAGSYRFSVESKGILLVGGSDIVSVYRNNRFEEAYACAGCTRYHDGNGTYEIVTAIWGHSNFADARQPSMMLDSAKGLSKVVAVHSIQEMESNWFFSYYEGELPQSLRVPQRVVETLIPINAWNTTRTPLRAVYRKTVKLNQGFDSFILEMRQSEAEAVLYVDGERVELLNPLNPFLDISEFVRGKKSAEIAFCVTKRDWNEPVGIPALYSGHIIKTCEFAALTEEQMVTAANGICDRSLVFPLKPAAGEILNISLPFEKDISGSMYLRIKGKNILVAAFVENYILGRVLLWDDSPKMAGDASSIYLPESYRSNQKELRFLLTALGKNAELSEVILETVN